MEFKTFRALKRGTVQRLTNKKQRACRVESQKRHKDYKTKEIQNNTKYTKQTNYKTAETQKT